MSESFLGGKVDLFCGDCLEILAEMPTDVIDSCVCDPPYHLQSIVKRFGAEDAAPAKSNGATGVYGRSSAGFMGKQWDGGDIAFRPDVWEKVLRVLKPGAHLLAFGGTRTYHRLACAIEDAGFEIRDAIMWHYGSGFPKSHDVSKAIDRAAGAERGIVGKRNDGRYASPMRVSGRSSGIMSNIIEREPPNITEPATDAARKWQGFGTALKPATEIICVARKPLIGTVTENVLRYGVGALNIDGCRIGSSKRVPGSLSRTPNSIYGAGLGGYRQNGSEGGHDQNIGRWPANIVHDGSDEVLAAFPEAPSSQGVVIGCEASNPTSAARFFYTAKADSDDRLGSKHPTVKPVDLMQWLVRLVTPKGGLVLDPFSGTGITGEAAWREGMCAILIEREAEYQADIRRRMELCIAGPAERSAQSAKARNEGKTVDHGPLFAE